MYNNCNLIAEIQPYETDGLTQGQIYQLAWDKVKVIAYRVFNEIMPLDEIEKPIEFSFEPLPIPPEPEPIPLQPGIEDYIVDLDYRISTIELGL
jgi:hypothetical protein